MEMGCKEGRIERKNIRQRKKDKEYREKGDHSKDTRKQRTHEQTKGVTERREVRQESGRKMGQRQDRRWK